MSKRGMFLATFWFAIFARWTKDSVTLQQYFSVQLIQSKIAEHKCFGTFKNIIFTRILKNNWNQSPEVVILRIFLKDNLYNYYFSYQAIQMSFFLLQVNGWTSKAQFVESKVDLNRRRSSKAEQAFQRFDACMRKNIKKHQEFTYTMMSQDDRSKAYGMIIHKFSRNYKGLLSFVYNKQTQMVSVLFNFLGKGDTFLTIQTKQVLVQFYRTIILAPEAQQSLLKLMVDHYNGSIHLKIAYFSLSNSNLIQDLDHSLYIQSKNLILQIYKQYFQPLVPLFEKALALTIPVERRIETEEQPKLVGNLYRYLKMMTIGAYLNSETVMSQEAREKQLKRRQENCIRLFKNQIAIAQSMIKPGSLFLQFSQAIKEQQTGNTQFFISQMEQKSLISVIATDGSGPKEPHTSAHVLNFIKLHEPAKLEVRPLNFGGFSVLQSAEVNFWYVESFGDAKSKELDPANMVRRYMAIKKDNRPHGKTLHESKILMEMRHGVSNQLPKYFIPVNVPGSDHNVNPLLMMELYTEGNLVEYLRHRYHFLSLLTKLYLMFSITMALRFLETYKIVHLDLKPNNIMLSPGLFIKLIDFGEAFHPEVCRNPNHRYRPGFTLPYSPPEFRYGLKYGFTSKSDVFSLGILMFEILYGRVPLETRQKLFLAAQSCDVFGDPILMRMLNWVISRCLSKNSDLRPELDWIAIILRLCLQLVV